MTVMAFDAYSTFKNKTCIFIFCCLKLYVFCSQRVELQKHILEQAHHKGLKSSQTKANPFQVSEDFVQRYNIANFEEKAILHNKAEQLLFRSQVQQFSCI